MSNRHNENYHVETKCHEINEDPCHPPVAPPLLFDRILRPLAHHSVGLRSPRGAIRRVAIRRVGGAPAAVPASDPPHPPAAASHRRRPPPRIGRDGGLNGRRRSRCDRPAGRRRWRRRRRFDAADAFVHAVLARPHGLLEAVRAGR